MPTAVLGLTVAKQFLTAPTDSLHNLGQLITDAKLVIPSSAVMLFSDSAAADVGGPDPGRMKHQYSHRKYLSPMHFFV